MENPSHSHGAPPAILDHTLITATRQKLP